MSPKMGLSLQEIGDAFSRKAFTFFSRKLNAYVIAYNEVLPFIEIVYYILHEIGHIYYEHVSPDKEVTDSLTNQESVANHFATFIFSQIGDYTMKTHTGNNDTGTGIVTDTGYIGFSMDIPLDFHTVAIQVCGLL